MATYMHFPGLKGNVKASQHKGWINCQNVQLQVHRQIHQPCGTLMDRNTSKPHFSHLGITKKMDQSSIGIFQAATKTQATQTVVLHFCQTDQAQSPYAEITLYEVLISEYRLQAEDSAGSVLPFEKILMSFEKIDFRYTTFDDSNQPTSPLSTSYDLKKAISL